MFHNVQSLNKHILDIEDFEVIHRRNCIDKRKPVGQIPYLKNHLQHMRKSPEHVNTQENIILNIAQ